MKTVARQQKFDVIFNQISNKKLEMSSLEVNEAEKTPPIRAKIVIKRIINLFKVVIS